MESESLQLVDGGFSTLTAGASNRAD